VLLPFVWKNFGFIFTCDIVLLFGVFQWKGYWTQEEAYDE
jgi:cell division protein FtsW (lipid II flippase)